MQVNIKSPVHCSLELFDTSPDGSACKCKHAVRSQCTSNDFQTTSFIDPNAAFDKQLLQLLLSQSAAVVHWGPPLAALRASPQQFVPNAPSVQDQSASTSLSMTGWSLWFLDCESTL